MSKGMPGECFKGIHRQMSRKSMEDFLFREISGGFSTEMSKANFGKLSGELHKRF